MNLPEFGVKRPVTNIVIFLGLIVIALYGITRLGVDLFPEIEPPVISVIAVYPGASPKDVETNVVEPLENQLATTPQLEKITSKCMEGIGLVALKFAWGVDLNEASNDIRDRIELAKRFLPDIPDEMENPFIFKFNTANIPILQIGIQGDESYIELYDMVDNRIVDQLKQLPGVGTVQLYGGFQKQINIWIDRQKLEGYGFSVLDIKDVLRRENITQPVGNVKTGLTDYLVRIPGEFENPEEINYVTLGERNGKLIYLKDVARIEDGFKELDMHVRVDKNPGLFLMVQKQVGTNSVQVARRVKKRLDELIKKLPPDVKAKIIFDTSADIVTSIDTLKTNLWYGILLVVLVVWFFLRSFKSSLIVAFTIPFSLLLSFIYLFMTDKTINIVSLSSLVIALGMVVDGAIVVVDNITRHVARGERPREGAIYGTMEIFFAVAASTLTTVVVFAPLLFVRGVVGIMFGELAAIIIITLFGALFTCATFTPMLCSKWIKPSAQKSGKKLIFGSLYNASEKSFTAIERIYASLIKFCIKHKGIVAFAFAVIFFTSLLMAPFIGADFFAEEDSGDLRVTAELPVGTRVEETDKVAARIEEIFEKEVPEKKYMFVRSGKMPGIAAALGHNMGNNLCESGVKCVKKDKRKRSIWEIAQVVRERIEKIGGVVKLGISTGSPIGQIVIGGGGKSIQVEVIGNSFEKTDKVAKGIMEVMRDVEGAVDISISREINRPEIIIKVDREKASSLGLDMTIISQTLKTYIEGGVASNYREEGNTYDITVRLEEPFRQSIEDIQNLIVISPYSGRQIRLSNIAKVEETVGPLEIERKNRERVLMVECNIHDRSMGEVVADVRMGISRMPLPEGVAINFGGEAEEQKEAFKDLFTLLVLGIILVYMVMAAQFESFLDPFIVVFSIPFTFTGVLLAFILTGTTLNVMSFLGVVMLMGIVVNNAIVLISYINILRSRAFSVKDSIISGCRDRLRPVLMTTLSTIVAMCPLAFFRGEGSESWQPLGITMIGGLSVSAFVTLFLIPTVYAIFEMRKENNREIIS